MKQNIAAFWKAIGSRCFGYFIKISGSKIELLNTFIENSYLNSLKKSFIFTKTVSYYKREGWWGKFSCLFNKIPFALHGGLFAVFWRSRGFFQLQLPKAEYQKYGASYRWPNGITVFCNSVALFVTALPLCSGTSFWNYLRRKSHEKTTPALPIHCDHTFRILFFGLRPKERNEFVQSKQCGQNVLCRAQIDRCSQW